MIDLPRRRALALGGSSLLLPALSHAQATYPASPITFVVGYAAGGSTGPIKIELPGLSTGSALGGSK